ASRRGRRRAHLARGVIGVRAYCASSDQLGRLAKNPFDAFGEHAWVSRPGHPSPELVAEVHAGRLFEWHESLVEFVGRVKSIIGGARKRPLEDGQEAARQEVCLVAQG